MIAAIIAIASALVTIAEAAFAVAAIAALVDLLFDPKGKQRVGNLIYNITGGALGVATELLKDVLPQVEAAENAFIAAVQANGGQFAQVLIAPFQDLTKAILSAQRGGLASLGTSEPGNALDAAAQAFSIAFASGLSSAGVAALFEAVFPEKLNILDGIAPILAKMAGFDEVAKAVLGPLYDAAFAKSLAYQYNSTFKPDFPSERDATTWYSRGLIGPAALTEVFTYSGLKAKYEQPYLAAAYRPVSPRILSRAVDTGAITHSDLISIMTFNGYRPQDQQLLLAAFDAQALQTYKQQTLSALMTAAERGTIPDAQLVSDLQALDVLPAAIPYIQETIAYRRLEQLAELYRKSVSEGYKYGTITDADYVTNLEAIGINVADAEAHYAVDSIAKQGRVLLAAARAEAALAKRQQHAAMTAAIAEFRAGAIDSVALLAAMLAAGVDPTIANFAVTLQTARAQGPQQFIFGLLLPRAQALALKEQVSALAVQTRAGLVSPADALTGLQSQNIPLVNAKALVAEWTATKTPAADVGVLQPR